LSNHRNWELRQNQISTNYRMGKDFAMLAQNLNLYSADRSGATALEYALLAGSIALAMVAAIGVLGDEVVALYNTIKITV